MGPCPPLTPDAPPSLSRAGAGWQAEGPAVSWDSDLGDLPPRGRAQGPPGMGFPGTQRTRVGWGRKDGGQAQRLPVAWPGCGSSCSRSGSAVGPGPPAPAETGTRVHGAAWRRERTTTASALCGLTLAPAALCPLPLCVFGGAGGPSGAHGQATRLLPCDRSPAGGERGVSGVTCGHDDAG